MLLTPDLLNLPSGYALHALKTTDREIQAILSSTADQAACPSCHTLSSRLHSHYLRTLHDVPSGGRRVILQVRSHKWRCSAHHCPRRVFAERLDPLAPAWAHMTTRLVTAMQAIGLSTNGNGGARLAHRLGMDTSATTMLHRIMAVPDPHAPPPEEIGIDDWSFRRGKRFGAIIVDLHHHTILDLLPDRDAVTVARWLAAHPTIRVVSRDRSREFARAITLGAPQAQQVLDRFHLLRNLVETLPLILARCFADVRRTLPTALEPETPPMLTEVLSYAESVPERGPWKPALTARAEAQRLAHQVERMERYARMQQLKQEGVSNEMISQQMGMTLRTVRRWLTHFRPDNHRRKRASEFDRYAEYVRERWDAGCHQGSGILREIRAQGFTGSSKTLYQHLRPLRRQEPGTSTGAAGKTLAHHHPTIIPTNEAVAATHRYTLTQTQWLFVTWPDELTSEERDTLAVLCHAHSTLASIYDLIQRFRTLLHTHPEASAILTWVQGCETSHVQELVRFAKGLREEWEPVVNGFTHAASNGQAEGFVNKLKLIKRQHYGRAGFALLRKHALLAG